MIWAYLIITLWTTIIIPLIAICIRSLLVLTEADVNLVLLMSKNFACFLVIILIFYLTGLASVRLKFL